MQTVLGFVLAMSITMVLMPLLIRWAGPLGFLDMPEARKVHASPVPRVGGIAMVSGILAALLIWCSSTRAMQSLLVCIALLLCFGVWDDRKNLSARVKFSGQAIAVAVVMVWGGVTITTMTWTERMTLPEWASVPLTFFFLLGCTNAFNLADGLDGLAGGMATLCLCGTALLAFTVNNAVVGSAAVAMVGALIGFLRFNTHPARVFMGDGGSQVLGFCAAALAILLTQDPQSPLSTALPLLLLGMPIIDTLTVMTERLLAHQSPFRADRRHIHHRLLALGFEHWEAVSILYLVQACLFVAAWFLRYDSDVVVVSVFLGFSAGILLPIYAARRFGWRLRRPTGSDWAVDTMVSSRGSFSRPRSAASWVLAASMVVYAVWVLVYGAHPSRDLRLLAIGLGVLLSVSLLIRRKNVELGWPEKIALYSSAALAIFLSKEAFPVGIRPPLLECILFPVLALAVVVCIRTSKDRPFLLTPLDILVLVVVITVPNLPDSVASTRSLGVAIGELVLLFYGLEALSFAAGQRWRWLSGGAAVFLFGVALRAIL